MAVEFNITDVPYWEQWFGVWAYRGDAFESAFRQIRSMNLHVHMDGGDPIKAQNASKRKPDVQNRIALIQLDGRLMKHASSFSGGTSTVQTRRLIRSAANSDDIDAIMLKIDSPGGTAAGTKELADDVAAADQKKPVFAYIEDLGASAAYWIASQARHLSTNATGIVGSIGTYGVVYDYQGAAAMEGIKAYVVKAGKHKGDGVPGTEVTSDMLQEYQRTIDSLNEHFLEGVARGRRMSKPTVEELADGRVHVGKEALELNLVDAVETFDEAFTKIVNLCDKKKSRRRQSMDADIQQTEKVIEDVVQVTETITPKIEAPVVATFQELQGICESADNDFVVDQLNAGATVDQATKAWMAKQKAQIADLQAKQAKPGVEPVRQTESSSTAGNPKQQWDEAIAAKVQQGLSKQRAAQSVNREQPELREAMIAYVNEQR